MKYLILTNNPLAEEDLGSTHDIVFIDGGLRDVLIRASEMINNGAVLLNHPLYGSVKPNETPYRSLLLQESGSGADGRVDEGSAKLIRNAIGAFEKFTVKKEIADAELRQQLLEDYQVVDLSLLKSAVQSADR
jgi:hypothetical protein